MTQNNSTAAQVTAVQIASRSSRAYAQKFIDGFSDVADSAGWRVARLPGVWSVVRVATERDLSTGSGETLVRVPADLFTPALLALSPHQTPAQNDSEPAPEAQGHYAVRYVAECDSGVLWDYVLSDTYPTPEDALSGATRIAQALADATSVDRSEHVSPVTALPDDRSGVSFWAGSLAQVVTHEYTVVWVAPEAPSEPASVIAQSAAQAMLSACPQSHPGVSSEGSQVSYVTRAQFARLLGHDDTDTEHLSHAQAVVTIAVTRSVSPVRHVVCTGSVHVLIDSDDLSATEPAAVAPSSVQSASEWAANREALTERLSAQGRDLSGRMLPGSDRPDPSWCSHCDTRSQASSGHRVIDGRALCDACLDAAARTAYGITSERASDGEVTQTLRETEPAQITDDVFSLTIRLSDDDGPTERALDVAGMLYRLSAQMREWTLEPGDSGPVYADRSSEHVGRYSVTTETR